MASHPSAWQGGLSPGNVKVDEEVGADVVCVIMVGLVVVTSVEMSLRLGLLARFVAEAREVVRMQLMRSMRVRRRLWMDLMVADRGFDG